MRCNLMLFFALAVLATGMTAHAVNIRDISFTTTNAGKVTFSHKSHIRQKQMANNCKSCHESIYPLKKKQKTSYTMADMEKGKSCGACHDGKAAFALKECARCHHVKEITYAVNATGPTRFSHKKHLAANPDCGTCHPVLFAAGHNRRVTMAEMNKGKSCGACHNGKAAFSIDKCASCHPMKDQQTFAVKGIGSVTFSHAVHTASLQCGSCHTRIYALAHSKTRVTMKQMEGGKSCGACHNGKAAFSIDKCASCHPMKDQTYAIKGAGNVTFSHAAHTGRYQCGSCHTKLYGAASSKTRVSMQAMERGKSCGACHNGKAAFSVKANCATCHKTT